MEIGEDKSIESEFSIPSKTKDSDFISKFYNKSTKILNDVPSILQPVLNDGKKLKELCSEDPTVAEGPLFKATNSLNITTIKGNIHAKGASAISIEEKANSNGITLPSKSKNYSDFISKVYNKSTKVLNDVPSIVQPVLNDGKKLKELCPEDPTVAEGPLFKATNSFNITTIKGNIQAKGASAISIEKKANSNGITLEKKGLSNDQSDKKSIAPSDDTTECAKVPLYKGPIQDSKMISKAKPIGLPTAKLLIVVPDDPTPIQTEAMQILKDLKKKFVSSEAFCRLCKTTKGLHNYASLIKHYQSHAGYRYLVQKNGVIINNSSGINTGNCNVGSTIKISGGSYVAPKLFKCVLCSKYFESNRALNKHLYTFHLENKAFDRDLVSNKDSVGDVNNEVDVSDENYGNNVLNVNNSANVHIEDCNPVNVNNEVNVNNPVNVNNEDYVKNEDVKDEQIKLDQLVDEFESEEDLKDADEELISDIKVEEFSLNV